MELSKIKEEISISYISAICAHADIAYEIIRHDDDSTDGELRKIIVLEDGRKYDARLRIQLKCTSSDNLCKDKGNTILYQLKVKNYNDLCMESTTPIILGLLVLPKDEKQWVVWSKEELILKGCMYWAEFSGKAVSSNTESVSIDIDKNNVVNENELHKILEKVAREEWP